MTSARHETYVAPSGAQFPIRFSGHEVVVVEAGGGLRSYTVDGRPILDGFAEDERIDGGRGQVLAPWPNRVKDGRYQWDGKDQQLSISEPDKNNAIHGLVRFCTWDVVDHADDALTVATTVWPQKGYPFTVRVAVQYRLDGTGLRVTTTGTNQGSSPAPWGCGQHPYLGLGISPVDALELQVPAASWLRAGEQQVPVGKEPVENSPYDFRAARAIGDQQIDTALTDLQRDADGRCVVRLGAPGGERGVDLWLDASYHYVMVFTGDTLPDPSRRRQGVALEPMTCPPNAFATGTDVTTLEPGQSSSSTWGITPW